MRIFGDITYWTCSLYFDSGSRLVRFTGRLLWPIINQYMCKQTNEWVNETSCSNVFFWGYSEFGKLWGCRWHTTLEHGWLKNYETMMEEVLDSVSRTCKCNGGPPKVLGQALLAENQASAEGMRYLQVGPDQTCYGCVRVLCCYAIVTLQGGFGHLQGVWRFRWFVARSSTMGWPDAKPLEDETDRFVTMCTNS